MHDRFSRDAAFSQSLYIGYINGCHPTVMEHDRINSLKHTMQTISGVSADSLRLFIGGTAAFFTCRQSFFERFDIAANVAIVYSVMVMNTQCMGNFLAAPYSHLKFVTILRQADLFVYIQHKQLP